MEIAPSVFSPIKLNSLQLRNRIIKTATYEGRCSESGPTEELTEWHRRIAQGGVGMTTLAYCAVHKDARTFLPQMYMRKEIVPKLEQFTEALAALETILKDHPQSDSAPEAIYLKGVSQYKSTNDPKPLKTAYEQLKAEYPSSEWTKRAYPYRLL